MGFHVPGKYRKKPVEIEALKWTGNNISSVAKFGGNKITLIHNNLSNTELYIETLEGKMKAAPGDWIIKGIKGEFYPCKPDIFDATYEAATPAEGVCINNFILLKKKCRCGAL